MPLQHVLLDKRYRSAWSRTLQLWKPLAIWTLLVWLVLTTIIVPATTTMIHWGFIRGDRLIISNEEILRWLMTPSGLLFFLLLGGLGIVASVVRFAGIFQILSCHMKEQPITTRQLAMEMLPKLPKLFRLSIYMIVIALASVVLLASGTGVIYYLFLAGRDINYYLTATPPEWYLALTLAAIWLFAVGGFILYLAARFSLALPAFLDCNITIRRALKNSWEIAGKRSVKILKMIGFTAVIWFFLLLLVDGFLLASTAYLIDKTPSLLSTPGTLTSIAGAYVVMSQVLNSIIGFLGFSFLSILITKFYYEDSDLQRMAPTAPGFSQLKSSLIEKFNKHFSAAKVLSVVMIFVLSGIGFGTYMIYEFPENDDVIILAHRTGPVPAPENTLAALELAIEQGADVAEIDVMRTADGTVIVFHDRDLMRMARDPRRVENVTYSEIESIAQIPEAGFPEEERQIVTLEEMLLRGKDRIEFMIELKYYGFDPHLAQDVLNVVDQTGMMEQVSIASLQLSPVLNLADFEPKLKLGYISAISIGNPGRLPVHYVALQHQQINGSLIKAARSRDIDVYAWTVNSPDQIAKMINLGVSGIITDRPLVAREIINEMRDLTLADRLLLNITEWKPAE